jgi:hypothetical protein
VPCRDLPHVLNSFFFFQRKKASRQPGGLFCLRPIKLIQIPRVLGIRIQLEIILSMAGSLRSGMAGMALGYPRITGAQIR